ncbi:MAG: hypothetical protein WBF58_23720 [Xanthobacteraceae bacterium]
MSDYNYNSDDPWRRDTAYDLNARRRGSAWGWIAGAVFLAIVLGIAFGVGHTPNSGRNNVFANSGAPPMAQPHLAPSGPAKPTYSPPLSPTNPAPANPAQSQPKP